MVEAECDQPCKNGAIDHTEEHPFSTDFLPHDYQCGYAGEIEQDKEEHGISGDRRIKRFARFIGDGLEFFRKRFFDFSPFVFNAVQDRH